MNRSNGETKARVRSVPAFFAEEERVAKDLESVQSIVKRFEAESGDSRGSEEINTRLSLIDSDSNSGSHKQVSQNPSTFISNSCCLYEHD